MLEASSSLNELREKIDDIDQQLQKLLVKRAEYAISIGKIKQSANTNYYRPEREAKILRQVMQRNCGPLEPKQMASIFRTILSACLALQKPLQIAFLGPKGTFSEMAAIRHFGPALRPLFVKNIPMIFKFIEQKQANYGIVPIENSISGLINLTLDQLITSPLKICGEVKIPIEQCFLIPRHSHGDIQRIYSHEQSFLQCKHWLTKHYPEALQIPCDSNADAVQKAKNDENAAAIAGEICANHYDLMIAHQGIQDDINNFTRFLIIGDNEPEESGDDKTTLLVTVNDITEAAETLINSLVKHQLNLITIKSLSEKNLNIRPLFFVEIDGHHQQPNFQKALQELVKTSLLIKILGSYPKAVV